jgi:hypothetical protein
MTASDIFLGCFAFGLIWSVAAVLLGGAHLHGAHGHVGHGHAGPVHGHALHGTGSATHNCGPGTHAGPGGWLEHFLSVHAIAIFLAWMGGCGYLTLRHTRWGIWLVLGISTVAGLGGAITLAAFLRFLHSREFAMDAADYEMVGVLGRVSSPIRRDGTGEMLFTRDGCRRLAYVRSESGDPIERDKEVVVTRYAAGIAYVRTWESLTTDQMDRQLMQAPEGSREEMPPSTH